jgi:hypothetical protein
MILLHPQTFRLAAAGLLSAGLTAGAAGRSDIVRNHQPEGPADGGATIWPIDCHLSSSRPEAAQPGSPDDLLLQFTHLHSMMRYEESAATALQLVERLPDRPGPRYNLACALSRLERVDEALAALRAAVACGWRNLAQLQADPDLDRIRRAPEWGSIVLDLLQRARQERPPHLPLRRDEPALIARDLQSAAPDLLARSFVPGCSIALVRGGKLTWQGAFGSIEAEGGRPLATGDTAALATPADLLAVIAAARADHDSIHALAEACASDPSAAPGFPSPRGHPARFSLIGHRDRRTLALAPDDMVELFRLTVELATDEPFDAHCRSRLLAPFGESEILISVTGGDAAATIRGHSVLGTPQPPLTAARFRGRATIANAGGLARLMELLLGRSDQARSAGLHPEAASAIDRFLVAAGVPSGLRVSSSPDGRMRRMELIEVSGGAGCLMRWYPATGDGVAILFNSATGIEAAQRLAHIALGGW